MKTKKRYCEWVINTDYDDWGEGHDTACGKQFVSDFTLKECEAIYCQYCGKKIKVVKSK
jgi:hypothetical protein